MITAHLNKSKRTSFTVLYPLDCFEYGGVTTVVQLYVRTVKKMGGTCVLLGYQGDLTTPEDYFQDAHIITIPRTNGTSFIERCTGTIDYMRALRQIYKKYPISLIHFSTAWSTLYTLMYQKTWHRKRIMTFHGALYLEEQSARQRPAKISERLGDMARWLIQLIGFVASNRIIVLSEYSLQLIRKCFHISRRHIDVIPGYIYDIPPQPIKRPHMKNKTGLQLLNIGRAEPRKGITLLLETAAYLRSISAPFKLTIASPVRYYQHFDVLEIYESLRLSTSVHLFHKVNQKESRELLQKSDLFIMPSLDLETFGLTALESLAMGIPVIATPTGALPEILMHITPHLLSKKTDSISLAKRIIWYQKLTQYEKKLLRTRCQNVVRNFFSEKHWQPKLMQLYETSNS